MVTSLLIFIVTAITSLPGLALIAYGLLADRRAGDRRKPRCRRCFYTLDGIATEPPATCPECGAVATKRRHLYFYFTRIQRLHVLCGVLLVQVGVLDPLALIFDVPRAMPTW